MHLGSVKTTTLFLRYVIPQMIGMIFNSIYFIVDGVFIGRRLGTDALAAAGVAAPVVEVMIAFAMLVAVGAGVMISVETGKGNVVRAREVFNFSVIVAVVMSLLVAIPGIVFARPLGYALGANDVILNDTMIYLRYFLVFSPFLVLSFALSTFVRNDGKPALAMWSLTLGAILNIVLDYVFMYPLNMGMAGAALATGLGPVFSVILLLPHFLKKQGNLYFQKPYFSAAVLGKLTLNGLPAFITEFSFGIVTLMYNISITQNGLGERGLAAYVVIGYVAFICLAAFLGAAQGIQPVVSYSAGQGDKARIQSLFKTTMLFNLLLSVVFYVALFFGGRFIYMVFITSDPSLVAFTAHIGDLYFAYLPFAAANVLIISFLQAMERTWPSALLSLSRSTLPVLVFLVVLPLFLGADGLWLAIICAEALTCLFAFWAWKKIVQKPLPQIKK